MSNRTETNATETKTYDAIVIGSGMGALAFAAIMSKLARKRVLVLERHFRAGGFTHTFRRPGGWEWDVGLHYVGGMAPGSMGRNLFDFITGRHVSWNPMPDHYDHFHYPAMTFRVPKGRAEFQAALTEKFPHERAAIAQYFRDLRSAVSWATRHFMANSSPGPIAAAVRAFNSATSQLPLTTTGQYLDRRFQDPQLRALLASQWGDYGLSPAQSAFAMHALIATHYFDGAFYPEGGSGRIAEGVARIVEDAGGDVLVNHEVKRILVEDGRATGVEVLHRQGKQGQTIRFHAPVVVSNAGAANTFTKLLPPDVPVPFRQTLEQLNRSTMSAATLYLGFKRDPRELGFQGENHWFFNSLDHDQMAGDAATILDGQPQLAYLSFPSLKDPQAARHTAEIIAPLPYEAVTAFRDTPWRRRGAEYDELKQKISKTMIEFVERHHPGFSNLVEFQELSTPLSVEHFTAHPAGGIYGVPARPERFRQSWLRPKTHVPGLYLTGADAGTLGIMGALMGGVATASQLLGPFGFFRIMAAAARESKAKPEPVSAAAVVTPH